jgi:NADPH:quinone reductase-like Zn-dependent oxidoreductase
VSAVTSSGNQVLVRALGASKTIDYAVRDVTAELARWDIVADAVGALTFARALPILSEGGCYLSIAGGLGELLALPRGSRRSICGLAGEAVADLAALADMAVAGTFRPLIDSVLLFARMPAAHAHADSGRKRGSVFVRLDHGQGQ